MPLTDHNGSSTIGYKTAIMLIASFIPLTRRQFRFHSSVFTRCELANFLVVTRPAPTNQGERMSSAPSCWLADRPEAARYGKTLVVNFQITTKDSKVLYVIVTLTLQRLWNTDLFRPVLMNNCKNIDLRPTWQLLAIFLHTKQCATTVANARSLIV